MFSSLRNVPKLVRPKKCLPILVRPLSVANESGVLKSTLPDLNIPDVSIPEHVFQNFDKFPNKIALECAVSGRKYTYEDVIIKSRNLSRSLRKKFKLSPGDVAAILLPNLPEYPICIYGCLQSKVAVTTINPIYTPDEISKQLIDSGAKVIITLPMFHPVATASINLTKKNIPIIAIKTQAAEALPNGTINLFQLFDEKLDIEDLQPAKSSDVALIPYSSGTTGLPKGVPLTHRNIIANVCQASGHDFRLHVETTEDHQDVVPAILPFFHIFGMTALQFVNMASLCKILTLPKFTPELFLKMLLHHKPHTLIVVPSIINFIANQSAVKKEYFPNTRIFFSGAAPLSGQDEEKLLNKVGHDKQIRQGYGLTETSPAVFMSSTRTASLGIRGSAGELMPNTSVKLVSSDNPKRIISTPGEHGELLVKGPQVMKGYLKDSDNSNAFDGEYFKTGDLMYYDDNQAFYVVERLKELIKVKGFQVAPAELEDLLRGHPDVLDAAVIGIPHSQYGEVPRAYLVPKPDHNIKPDTIKDFIADKVANYKQLLGGISVIDAIPKNMSGKILRKDLKSLYNSEAKLCT
ncbi:hypothetical protein FQR65_LT08774 [Abscondita terminalis]|nr:hypothetical protein FQR65_LT08774 [Abscondita terminalis]